MNKILFNFIKMLFRLFKLIIWIIVISGSIFYINYSGVKNYESNNDFILKVHQGDNTRNALIRELELSESYLKFFLYLNPLPDRFLLKSGEYNIKKGDSLKEIINKINYRSIQDALNKSQERLTILEGWNIFDIDEHLTNRGLINKGDFILEARNIEKYKDNYSFLEDAISLEGFLYPDTYFIIADLFNKETIIKTMLSTFNSRVYIPLLKDLKTSKDIVEIINMSSIVEREASKKGGIQEKSTIAGILWKRYRENWFIGADITVCYPYELTSNDCRMVVSKYIRDINDYNTRTMLGLPKTPINNPHVSTIKATIDYIDTPYYYYLHAPNGQIHYARTNDEHNRNRSLYLNR